MRKSILFLVALFALSFANINITLYSPSTSPYETFTWTAVSDQPNDTTLYCNLTIDGVVVTSDIECTAGPNCTYTYDYTVGLCEHSWEVACTNADNTNYGSTSPTNFYVPIQTCGQITGTGTCTLENNLTSTGGDCLVINSQGIKLNCNGFTISGANSGSGIYVNSSGVNINNCTVKNFQNGIKSTSKAKLLTISDSSFYANTLYGADLLASTTIQNSKFYNNSYGINISSAKIIVSGTSFLNNTYTAITILDSPGSSVNNVFIEGSDIGIYNERSDTFSAIGNTIVNGTYKKYGMGMVLFTGVNNSIIKSNTFSAIAIPIYIARSGYINVTANNIICSAPDSTLGIEINNSNYLSLHENIIDNCGTGLSFKNVTQTTFYNNKFNVLGMTIDTESEFTANTTKRSGTNIIGKPAIGGNAWFYPGDEGYSETCEDNDGDYFCDSPLQLGLAYDFLPLAVNQGFNFEVRIDAVDGKRADIKAKFDSKEYVAATNSTSQNITFSINSKVNGNYNCISSLGGMASNVPNNGTGTITLNKEEGCYPITVTCTNVQSITSPEVYFCVDRTAPIVGFGLRNSDGGLIINPYDGEVINSTHSFTLNMSANDPSSTFIEYCSLEWWNESGTNLVGNLTFPPTNQDEDQFCTIVMKDVINDTYKYKMYVYDAAGNYGETEYRTVTINASPSGCAPCENLTNFKQSFIMLVQDQDAKQIRAVLYSENSSGGREPVPKAPILVWVRNSTDKNLFKVITNENGTAYFSYEDWENIHMEYAFIYCCFYQDCGFEMCLNASGIDQSYRDLNKIYNIDSVPTFNKPPQPQMESNAPYMLPAIQKIDIAPEVCNSDEPFCQALNFQQELCIPVMLLFGLLLGALYYTGRNPFALFDFSPLRIGRHIRYSPRGMQTGVKVGSLQMAGMYTTLKTTLKKAKEKKAEEDTKELEVKSKGTGKEAEVAKETLTKIKMIKSDLAAGKINKREAKKQIKEALKSTGIKDLGRVRFKDIIRTSAFFGGGTSGGSPLDKTPIGRLLGGGGTAGVFGLLGLLGLRFGGLGQLIASGYKPYMSIRDIIKERKDLGKSGFRASDMFRFLGLMLGIDEFKTGDKFKTNLREALSLINSAKKEANEKNQSFEKILEKKMEKESDEVKKEVDRILNQQLNKPTVGEMLMNLFFRVQPFSLSAYSQQHYSFKKCMEILTKTGFLKKNESSGELVLDMKKIDTMRKNGKVNWELIFALDDYTYYMGQNAKQNLMKAFGIRSPEFIEKMRSDIIEKESLWNKDALKKYVENAYRASDSAAENITAVLMLMLASDVAATNKDIAQKMASEAISIIIRDEKEKENMQKAADIYISNITANPIPTSNEINNSLKFFKSQQVQEKLSAVFNFATSMGYSNNLNLYVVTKVAEENLIQDTYQNYSSYVQRIENTAKQFNNLSVNDDSKPGYTSVNLVQPPNVNGSVKIEYQSQSGGSSTAIITFTDENNNTIQISPTDLQKLSTSQNEQDKQRYEQITTILAYNDVITSFKEPNSENLQDAKNMIIWGINKNTIGVISDLVNNAQYANQWKNKVGQVPNEIKNTLPTSPDDPNVKKVVSLLPEYHFMGPLLNTLDENLSKYSASVNKKGNFTINIVNKN